MTDTPTPAAGSHVDGAGRLRKSNGTGQFGNSEQTVHDTNAEPTISAAEQKMDTALFIIKRANADAAAAAENQQYAYVGAVIAQTQLIAEQHGFAGEAWELVVAVDRATGDLTPVDIRAKGRDVPLWFAETDELNAAKLEDWLYGIPAKNKHVELFDDGRGGTINVNPEAKKEDDARAAFDAAADCTEYGTVIKPIFDVLWRRGVAQPEQYANLFPTDLDEYFRRTMVHPMFDAEDALKDRLTHNRETSTGTIEDIIRSRCEEARIPEATEFLIMYADRDIIPINNLRRLTAEDVAHIYDHHIAQGIHNFQNLLRGHPKATS